jgi:hypothetical protein
MATLIQNLILKALPLFRATFEESILNVIEGVNHL